MVKKYHLLGAALAMTFVLGGCTSSTSKNNDGPKLAETTEATTTQMTTTTAVQNQFQMGDTVAAGDFEIRVDNKNAQKEVTFGNGFMKYTADGTYLILDVTYKNTGNSSKTLNSNSFSLQLGDTKYTPTTLIGMDDNIFLETINPGIEKQGQLYFDVPEDIVDASGLQLKMSPDLFTTKNEFYVQLNS